MRRTWTAMALAIGVLLLGVGVTRSQDEQRAYLGVFLSDLSEGVRTALGLGEDEGVLIDQVAEGGPAAEAGLRAGDVIVEFGGERITGSGGLHRRLDRQKPGQQVPITVLRKGQRQTIQVTLGGRARSIATAPEALTWGELGLPSPPEPPSPPSPPGAPAAPTPLPRSLRGLLRWDSSGSFGIRTQDLTGQLAEYFQVSRGVLVTWVSPGGAGAKAGLKAGDVIVSVAGQPIQGEGDLQTVLSDLEEGGDTPLTVSRRGNEMKLTIKTD